MHFLRRLPVAQINLYASSAAVILLAFAKPLGSHWN